MLNHSGEKKSYTLGHSFIYGEKKSYNSAKRNILSGLCKIRQFFFRTNGHGPCNLWRWMVKIQLFHIFFHVLVVVVVIVERDIEIEMEMQMEMKMES
jgi:hypothetical protein